MRAMLAAIVLASPSCSIHIADNFQSRDPAEAFTSTLTVGVPSSRVGGPLAAGVSGGPQVLPLPGSTGPATVGPNSSLMLQIPYSGGAISSINIGFGGSSFFQVPAPQAAGMSSGVVQVPVQAGNFCAGLADICHMIQCYEQVQTPAGTVSVATAQQMVLNCTGGRDCNGMTVPDSGTGGRCGDGICNNLEGSSTCPSDCGNTPDECCVRTNGCPGETGHSCGATCCCCPGGSACGMTGGRRACVSTP